MKDQENVHYLEDDFGDDWTEEVRLTMQELKESMDLPTEEVEKTFQNQCNNRRQARRIEIHVPVMVGNLNRITETFLSNMNYSGCFVETEAPCEIGDVVDVHLSSKMTGIGGLLHGDVKVDPIKAIVRWRRTKRDNPEEYDGMGLEFVNLTQRQSDQIYRILLISETETLLV